MLHNAREQVEFIESLNIFNRSTQRWTNTLALLVLLWKRRQVTEVLCATVILVGALEFLRSYW